MPDNKNGGKEPLSTSKKIRNDVILVLALLLIVAAILIPVLLFREEGTYITVTVNGELYGTYSLSLDREIMVENPLSEEYVNVIVIKDGKAYISEANCRNGRCARHAAVHISGEIIACLPHKLVLTVKGGGGDVDIIG